MNQTDLYNLGDLEDRMDPMDLVIQMVRLDLFFLLVRSTPGYPVIL